MTETQWRMKCYYCEQYKNGTCPYEKRKAVPKRCRKFVHPSMYVPGTFSGFEKVIIAIMILIVAIFLMLFAASLILMALPVSPI